jgi:hypothetical protein
MLHPESQAQRSGTPADGSVTHTESASDGANGLRRREQAQKREILLPHRLPHPLRVRHMGSWSQAMH